MMDARLMPKFIPDIVNSQPSEELLTDVVDLEEVAAVMSFEWMYLDNKYLVCMMENGWL